MSISKAKSEANKRHDDKHFKYQTVKMKLEEHEQMKRAVDILGVPANNFMRTAIMDAVEKVLKTSE